MNNPLLVRGGQAMGNLDPVIHCLSQGQRAVFQPVAQGLTFQQLGYEVRAILVSSKLIDTYDVGMVEGCRRLGFLFEAHQAVWLCEHKIRQDLDGDVTPQRTVACSVDFSHAAGAKHGENFVRS